MRCKRRRLMSWPAIWRERRASTNRSARSKARAATRASATRRAAQDGARGVWQAVELHLDLGERGAALLALERLSQGGDGSGPRRGGRAAPAPSAAAVPSPACAAHRQRSSRAVGGRQAAAAFGGPGRGERGPRGSASPLPTASPRRAARSFSDPGLSRRHALIERLGATATAGPALRPARSGIEKMARRWVACRWLGWWRYHRGASWAWASTSACTSSRPTNRSAWSWRSVEAFRAGYAPSSVRGRSRCCRFFPDAETGDGELRLHFDAAGQPVPAGQPGAAP